VYGVHRERRPFAYFSKYCRGVFAWDLDSAPQQHSVGYLAGIARVIGGRPLLIPTNDETALFVAQNAEQLQRSFQFSVNPLETVWALYNKREMYLLAKRLLIPTAETVFPKSRKDVVELCEKLQFPVMLKASDNITISRRTGKKMVIVQTRSELIANYDAMEDCSSPGLMIQEYIPGDDGSVWMFNGYFDENSECLFGITGKKIHQTPVYTGMTALGVCLPNPDVESATKRLVKAVGYRGILDIGYRYDPRDSSYKLLDVNPRLGATFRLFVANNEMDVARAHYLHFTGQPIPRGQICVGRKWVVEDSDITSCIQYLRDGVLTLPGWLTSYGGVQEAAWFASDDLLPFCRMCSDFSVRPFRKALKAVRRYLKPNSTIVMQHANAIHKSPTGSD
jgi:predicted ATP-grasp superfamily ATP-dependent carboligase